MYLLYFSMLASALLWPATKISFQKEMMSTEIIEDSIIKYRRHTDHRKKVLVNDTDYQFVDVTLLESALSEKPVTR